MTDEFDGKGGSYVVDPKTGKRRLVERTVETQTGEQAPEHNTPDQPQQTEA